MNKTKSNDENNNSQISKEESQVCKYAIFKVEIPEKFNDEKTSEIVQKIGLLFFEAVKNSSVGVTEIKYNFARELKNDSVFKVDFNIKNG